VRATLDTSVLFQALHGRRGASFRILQLVREAELVLAISVPVFSEYQDVLLREETQRKLGFGEGELEVILQFVATVGRPTPIEYLWRPNLRDESDNMFVELARASGSEYLITDNVRDFIEQADLRNDDIAVVTPGQFIKRWRNRHGQR
jgi:putative PIN family toxin of toxin-antitoxin system